MTTDKNNTVIGLRLLLEFYGEIYTLCANESEKLMTKKKKSNISKVCFIYKLYICCVHAYTVMQLSYRQCFALIVQLIASYHHLTARKDTVNIMVMQCLIVRLALAIVEVLDDMNLLCIAE